MNPHIDKTVLNQWVSGDVDRSEIKHHLTHCDLCWKQVKQCQASIEALEDWSGHSHRMRLHVARVGFLRIWNRLFGTTALWANTQQF